MLPPIGQCRYHFPDPRTVDLNGEGLIGFGGDLSASTLLHAYRTGIFPWFNEAEPIAWWCPAERAVFDPAEFRPSRSLRRSTRRGSWQFSFNQRFEQVIRGCAQTRQEQTWISPQMIQAYVNLHALGVAYSFEVSEPNGALIGGLYGLKIGAVFCAESMFHLKTDASKAAFWLMTQITKASGIELIDAQLENPHLMSLGASLMTKIDFLEALDSLKDKRIDWSDPESVMASINMTPN